MEIHTIGIDLARPFFTSLVLTHAAKLWCARSVRAISCCASQLTFACAWSVWRPAEGHIFLAVLCERRGTMCG